MHRRTFIAGTASATLASVMAGRASAAGKTIVVGGKDFTEQLVMAEMTAQLLRAHGFGVDTRTAMGSTVLRKAMENGQVDVYWEYTGTALIVYDKIKKHLSPQETYDTVKKLDAKRGIVWLNPSSANNTYALVMNRAEADKLNIHTISDLAKAINGGKKLTFASDAEFAGRADGLRPLEKTYGFMFGRANLKQMDSGLTYQALHNHQVDMALAFATDGRIPAFDFVVLKDNKDFFPAYALTPVVRQKTLAADPKLSGLLNGLSAKLDDATMAKLNASVDVDKKTVQAVASTFLKSQNLV
mgnify:CR=1 FL=1